MNYRTLPHTELRISDIGLGTMTFGEQTDEACAHAQLDYALDHGINLIDAAEMYPVPGRRETQGRTETFIGRWLKTKPRDRIVLATKVAGPSRGFSWIRGGPTGLDAANITQAVEGSLKRLQTDYIDLYQIHWPARPVPMFGETRFSPQANRAAEPTPIEEQLQALAALIQAGKIRHIGLSNETPWGVMRFLEAARAYGLPRIATIQNAYNLVNRVFEQGLDEICYHEGLGLLAYSPLAFGLLTGKYIGGAEPEARLVRFPEFGPRYRKPYIEPAVRAYADLAAAHNVPFNALALSFVRSQFFTASTLIGARTLAQLKDDLEAASLLLDEPMRQAIEEIHRRFPNPAP